MDSIAISFGLGCPSESKPYLGARLPEQSPDSSAPKEIVVQEIQIPTKILFRQSDSFEVKASREGV